MEKFVFKLQPLLNIKTQMEDGLKNELGKAIQKLEVQNEKKRKIEDDREKNIVEFSEKSGAGIRIEKLREYTAYISLLADKIEEQNKNIKLAEENVDKYREKLIKIVKEKKMLEKLKEKKFADYLRELDKDQQKIIDELVSYKYTEHNNEDQNG